MAQNKLTYHDKSNPVAVVNRKIQATAEDFNEIKAAVNNNAVDVQNKYDELKENQYTGVVVYETLAGLPVTGTLLVSYKVSNDPTPSNNGFYHWNGSVYVKDADLVNGAISTGETQAITGDKVNNLIHSIGISSLGTISFSYSGSTIYVTFSSAGNLYARGYDGSEVATTTVQQSQTYTIPTGNNVLVWNIDSNTIDVQGVAVARDAHHIVLLHVESNGNVSGGYFADRYWNWKLDNDTNNVVAFTGAGNLDVEFSKDSSNVHITFPTIGSMYAVGKNGDEFASTTAHLSQTYSFPNGSNNVLVWDIDSDTVSVKDINASRDVNNIILFHKAYFVVTGGQFASKYLDWNTENKSVFDISFSGVANAKVDFSLSGTDLSVIFPDYGPMYAVGKHGFEFASTNVHIGQTYVLPGGSNNVLVWNIDSDTIDVQTFSASRDANSIVLIRKAYYLVTGGYFAPQYWDWETLNQAYNYTSNVDFMSREGRVNGFPGNSYLSVYECKRVQIPNIRVSVRETSDGYIVLSHDDAINDEARETNGDPIATTVNISENTLATLNTYDYGIKYGAQYAGLAIAELEEMINVCAKMGMKLTLEFKYAPTTLVIESICKLISKYSMVENTWISATNTLGILSTFNLELDKLNIALISYISSAAITSAATYKTGSNKVRLDIFDTDVVTEALWYQAAQDGVDLKVGSVYVAANIPLWYNKGVKVIEVQNIQYPDKWLNEY